MFVLKISNPFFLYLIVVQLPYCIFASFVYFIIINIILRHNIITQTTNKIASYHVNIMFVS